ncbi:MAG: hypothetical protein WC889_01040 [Myxococcota bacterium]|jgi:hypothetical protein
MNKDSRNGNSASSALVGRRKPQGILVLGMHRSGTSAITRVLNLLGCVLPDKLIGAGDGNELGHWESVAAVTLNNEILVSAGSSWEDWGPINEDWRASALRAAMLDRVADVVNGHAALGPLFALKDPRLCRLADLWLEGMAAAGVEPLAILMLRHPGEVAASLENRDLMATGYGQLLWLRHVLDSECFSRGTRRVVCRYDQLMHDWPGTIDRIKANLDIALPRNSPVAHAEVESFLTGKQRHHDAGAEATLGNVGTSVWLKRTFEILREWSEQGENEADYPELDRMRDEFDRAYMAFARLLLSSEFSGQGGSGSQLKRELSEQLAEAQRTVEVTQNVIREADAQRASVAARECELIASIEAGGVRAQQLQAEIDVLRAEAEQLGIVAAEANALKTREAALSEEIAGLQFSLLAMQADVEQEREERRTAEQKLAASMAELQESAVHGAELAGRAAASESALLQRQEELAQLWNQLLDAEKAGAVAEAEANHERERRLDGEQQLAEAESSIADLRTRLDAALAAPAPAPDHLFAEIAQLTRMLQEQEAARIAAEQVQASLSGEISALTARVHEQEAARQTAEAARAATDQKLTARFDEIARLTAMLADESHHAAASNANSEWLRTMLNQVARLPKWWSLMPTRWRRKKEHSRYRNAGLFDAERYLETYPDVAADGMDPVRHYILHGITEGRQRPQ